MRKRKFYWLIGLFTGIILTSHTFKNDIVLSDDPFQITPEGFYINSVTDDRTAHGPIATLVAGVRNNKAEIQEANLQGGVANGISNFINRNLKKDSSERAVNISIKDFKLSETVLPNGGVDGRIQINLSFGQPKDYGIQQLIEYRGGLHYTRMPANSQMVETHLRSAIKAALVYFNNWMHININGNPKLAKAVAFTFTDHIETATEGDTIYYSASRPLAWNDFQSKIRPPGPFNAVVMPNFGYNMNQDIKNGVINVCLELKTFMAKSDSWVGTVRDAYALNHEQRHFDIARIITKRYKQKVLGAGLTPDTYEAFISMQYFDSYRDMNTMQKAYDKETRHGINEQAQTEWNKKIDEMLKEQDTPK